MNHLFRRSLGRRRRHGEPTPIHTPPVGFEFTMRQTGDGQSVDVVLDKQDRSGQMRHYSKRIKIEDIPNCSDEDDLVRFVISELDAL